MCDRGTVGRRVSLTIPAKINRLLKKQSVVTLYVTYGRRFGRVYSRKLLMLLVGAQGFNLGPAD